MKDYLVFQLYAPLASWGGQAVGQERPSDDHPGRSALLGLLAAALGITRDNEEAQQALRDSCRFGVKLCAPGLALRDFHTVSAPKGNNLKLMTRRDEILLFEEQSKSMAKSARPNAIVSYRSYQQDAFCVIAVTNDDQLYSVEQLRNALLTPVFPLYLGRKSCPPAMPLNPQVKSAENLKAAFDAYSFDPILDRVKGAVPRYYWEEGMAAGMAHDYRAPRYDQPISRRRWQFSPRDEYVYLGGE